MITHKEARQPDPLPPSSIPMQASGPSSHARYYVLGLGFLVALVMFLDRACMGTATPMIMREFHLDKITMGWSVSAFNWTYAMFQVPGGWLADRFSVLLEKGAVL
jgi:ACS family glucarate transporter-like MFS transporter